MSEQQGLEGVAFGSSSGYVITEELGRGGMGIVYLAQKDCEGVQDYVVLKTLKTIDPAHIERLRHEANIATFLRHENIVKTYGLEAIPRGVLPPAFQQQLASLTDDDARHHAVDATQKRQRRRLVPPKGSLAAKRHQRAPVAVTPARDEDKLYCMAMDYVEGTDLGHLHREHLRTDLLLPCPLAAFIVSRICRALAYAHQFIVHRDVSPENILINTHGVAKLTDFGIAVSAGAQQEFAGKLKYMAPEQLRREPVDARADIFALGVVAYQILTGVMPLAAPRGMPLSERIAHVLERLERGIPAPDELCPDVPKVLSHIVMGMLAPRASDRYAEIGTVGNHLEKRYLYAHGFGPTNNSLGAYIEIFQSGFREHTQEQLAQLTFLTSEDASKRLRLRRPLAWKRYAPAGQRFINETQADELLARVLRRQQQQQREAH